MTAPLQDADLVSAFLKKGAESAFQALVRRHVDLVFATALRQTGDRGIAEEITQNVFLALARKAPSLAGYNTLAGWLHKSTLLEARARIRGELRRKAREETAAEIYRLNEEGTSPLEPLVPLLDEALLDLRETDRVALISRFFENKSLRDVGLVLGIDEDAARKRVSRALDRLSEFFRQRGFALPAGTGAAALLSAGVQAAPASLAGLATQTALAAGGTAGGLQLLIFNLMALSKTKSVILCAAMLSAPLLWQAKTQADLNARSGKTAEQISRQQLVLAQLAAERDALQQAALEAMNGRFAAETRLAALQRQKQGTQPPPRYEWNDTSPLVRVPKEFLKWANLSSFTNRAGQISQPMKDVLQLGSREAAELQAATDAFLATFAAAQQRSMRYEPPSPADPTTGTPEERRTFRVGDTREDLKELRAEFFASAQAVLGSERFEVFRKGLIDWMPLDAEANDSRSSDSLAAAAHEVTCQPPDPQQSGRLRWQVKFANGSMSYWMAPEEVPAMFVPHLQDWIIQSRAIQSAQTQAIAQP